MEQRRNTPPAVSYVESRQTTITRIVQRFPIEALLLVALLLIVIVLLLGG